MFAAKSQISTWIDTEARKTKTEKKISEKKMETCKARGVTATFTSGSVVDLVLAMQM